MLTQNKTLFDIIAITPGGTIGLCCVYIAQLMSHTAIYTLPITLHLYYKPLGILQRVTKSQRVVCNGGVWSTGPFLKIFPTGVYF